MVLSINAHTHNYLYDDMHSPSIIFVILGYVDDVLEVGSAEKIRRCIRNMRRLEKLKKYSFGREKTKYIVINTGKEEEELIEEEVDEE